jgi:uncharacterized membrane protein (Fun14 family)
MGAVNLSLVSLGGGLGALVGFVAGWIAGVRRERHRGARPG